MQLSELLYQRVKEMGERGQLVLKPGYCVVVGKSRSLKHVLLAALFQTPDDQRNLAEAGGFANPFRSASGGKGWLCP